LDYATVGAAIKRFGLRLKRDRSLRKTLDAAVEILKIET
jgi:hypothetical protein